MIVFIQVRSMVFQVGLWVHEMMLYDIGVA